MCSTSPSNLSAKAELLLGLGYFFQCTKEILIEKCYAYFDYYANILLLLLLLLGKFYVCFYLIYCHQNLFELESFVLADQESLRA